jgi:hypothetical protein
MGVSLTMRVYPKSAAVDAEQWLGWEHHGDGDLDVYVNQSDPTTGYMEVYRGVETINVGDWIVTHVNGRRTPYTPAAFKRIFAELPATTLEKIREFVVTRGCSRVEDDAQDWMMWLQELGVDVDQEKGVRVI